MQYSITIRVNETILLSMVYLNLRIVYARIMLFVNTSILMINLRDSSIIIYSTNTFNAGQSDEFIAKIDCMVHH